MKRTVVFVAVILLVVLACSAFAAAKAPRGVRAPRQGGAAQPDWWGRPPGDRPVAQGIVKEVGPAKIAIQTREGIKAFVVNDKTRVMIRGQRATIADIKVGDQVIVRFALQQNNVPLALGILIPKPAYAGQIVSIEGNVITLKSKEGTQLKVLVTDATKYRSKGYVGTFADLRVGYRMSAHGEVSGNVLTAVGVEFVPTVARGTIVAVEGNTITLKAVKQFNVVCVASPETVVIIRPRVGPNTKGTLADVKPGTPANMGFHAADNSPGALLWIELLTGI